jgi:hypothetical protein
MVERAFPSSRLLTKTYDGAFAGLVMSVFIAARASGCSSLTSEYGEN